MSKKTTKKAALLLISGEERGKTLVDNILTLVLSLEEQTDVIKKEALLTYREGSNAPINVSNCVFNG